MSHEGRKKIATASAALLAFIVLAGWPGHPLSNTFRGDKAFGEYLGPNASPATRNPARWLVVFQPSSAGRKTSSWP